MAANFLHSSVICLIVLRLLIIHQPFHRLNQIYEAGEKVDETFKKNPLPISILILPLPA